MTKKQNNEPTLFYDELKNVYKDKLAVAEKRIKNAEEQVASDTKALDNCRVSNEKPELQNDLRESQKVLSDAIKQRQAILAELKDLEK